LPEGSSFHEYYGRPKEDVQPWVYFSEDDAHELAHAILVGDDDVLDPHWGIEVGDVLATPPISEMEVFAIQLMIERWCGLDTEDPAGSSTYKVLVPLNAVVLGSSEYPRAEAARMAHRIRKEWDIERIWAEYQRKVGLVFGPM
jgi:hypothetical protein